MARKRRTDLPGTSQSESGEVGGVTQQPQQPQPQQQGRYEGAGRGAPQRGGYAGQTAVGSGGVQYPPAQQLQQPQQPVRPQQQGGRGWAPQPGGLQPQQQGAGRGMAPQRGGYGRGGPGGRMPTPQYGGAPGYQQGRGGLQYQQGGPPTPQRPDGGYGGGRGISGQALNLNQAPVGSQPSPSGGAGMVDAGSSSSAKSMPDVIEQTQKLSLSTEVVPSQVMQPASSKSVRFPRRPDVEHKLGRKCFVKANHFLVELKDKDVHHYDITITPEVRSRGLYRAVINHLVRLYKESHLGMRLPAYDGRKSLYTAGPLPFETKEFEINLPAVPGGTRQDRTFKVQIKFAARYDMHQLKLFCERQRPDAPQEALQVLDIVLQQVPTSRYVPFGRSFYDPVFCANRQPADLGNGLEGWCGYYQSVRPTQMGLSLNIDKSATAFFKPVSVVEFVYELLPGLRQDRPLSQNDHNKVKKALKGVKIEVTHRGRERRKYRVAGLTSQPIRNLTFPIDDAGTVKSVIQYFREKYSNVVIQNPQLPCIQVGSPQRLNYLPMEVCVIIKGQRYPKKLNENQTTALLNVTCQNPRTREENILEIVHSNSYGNDAYAEEFGITVTNAMTRVEARVLPTPRISYSPKGRDKDCMPQVGAWNMMNKKMYEGARVDRWACIDFARSAHSAEQFLYELANMCNISGMEFNLQSAMPILSGRSDAPKQSLDSLRGKNLDLLIAILPDSNGYLYGNIKRICETELGIVSQCCLRKNVSKMGKQFLANVALKINVKVGGINNVLSLALAKHIPVVSTKPTIIFGADVTHPSPGEDSSPSIAAVVASQDLYMTKYATRIAAQASRVEIIQDLGTMVRELLISFRNVNRYEPGKIIFYRDGVSEGQFATVLQHELTAIRKVCIGLSATYRPEITFIVVQKRHHTRLFPDNYQDRNASDRSGNIIPGTVVDSKICHPTEFDFYLCSHGGIKGTSRPAHYHVLWDDSKFTPDDLQSFTNNLCYTFARCTRSVSVAPPAYYAHLAAFRARFYLGPGGESDAASSIGGGGAGAASSSTRANATVPPLPALAGNLRNSMFFC